MMNAFPALPALRSLLLAISFATPSLAQDPPEAAAFAEDVELARRDFAKGAWWRAADTLNEVLAVAPGLVGARVLLLDVSAAQGDLDKADELAAGLAGEVARGDRAAALSVARYADARGRLDDAAAIAQALLESDPADLDAAHLHASILWQRGRRDDARRFVQETIARLPRSTSDPDLFFGVARLYGVVGELEIASEHCVQAEDLLREQERSTADVLVFLGDLYRRGRSLQADRQPKAFATYRDALAQNPSLVAAKVGRARTHLYVSDVFDAQKELDDALGLNPKDAEALTVRAWIRVLDGACEEALEATDAALEVNPAFKEARATRAAALHLLRRDAERDAELARVLELDPRYGEAFQIIGDAVSRHYRFAEAIPFHRRALEVDPDLALARVSLGRDLAFLGEEGEAYEALEASLETDPYPHPWRFNMLTVLKKFGTEYVDTSADGFLFRVHVDENPILGPRLIEAFAEDTERLSARYGWRPQQDLLVEAFPQHADFSVRTVGFSGLGAVGACFGRLVTLISPRAPEVRGTFVWRRTALHELAHVYTLGRSRSRIPRWLSEGLSVYEERCADPTWARDEDRVLLDAVANGELIPLRDFNSVFHTPRIGFAYYQGGLFAEFVTDAYGFDRILAMLDGYAADHQTEQVVRDVFDRGLDEMDREFEEWVRSNKVAGTRVQTAFSPDRRRDMRAKLREMPDDADLLVDLAWAHYQAGKEVDADVFLDKAFRSEPTHAGALRLAARRAMDRKRPDLARTNLENAFANGGEEFHAALLLAALRERDGDAEGALAALEIAKRCFPAAAGPMHPSLRASDLLAAEGRMQEAMEELAAYVAVDETAFAQRMQLASYHDLNGDPETAYRYLREAEQIEPFDRDVYVKQGDALRDMKRPSDAIAALRTALLVDPRLEPRYHPPRSAEEQAAEDEADREERADILANIAEVEFEVGDAEAARRDLDAALRLSPDHSRARELRERLQS